MMMLKTELGVKKSRVHKLLNLSYLGKFRYRISEKQYLEVSTKISENKDTYSFISRPMITSFRFLTFFSTNNVKLKNKEVKIFYNNNEITKIDIQEFN
ncbi:MAG: hypothetical protein COA67_11100 [Lutibacter sp.]|nr:MAG: hypothetical protein COA67_11100 [Lutibacter sp.]